MKTEFITIPIDIIGELPRGKPFTNEQAYIDIILMADESGEVLTSERRLMNRWGWGNNKVRRFLELLEKQSTCEAVVKQSRSTKILINTSSISVGRSDNEALVKQSRSDKTQQKEYYPNDEKLNQSFVEFVKMRERMNVSMSDDDVKIIMRKLQKLTSDNRNGIMDNDKAIEILEQSIVNHWKSVYPLKENKGSQTDLRSEWRKY